MINFKSVARAGVCTVVFVLGGVALAKTSYIVPWYVNPTLKAQLHLGADQVAPVDLNLGEKGDWLMMTAESSSAPNVWTYDASKLAGLSGVVTNCGAALASYASGLGSSPLAAVTSARTQLLALDGAMPAAVALKPGHNRWVGRFAPGAVTFTSGDAFSSADFDASGLTLYANSTVTDRGGKLIRWTCSNGTFAKTAEFDTGLNAVGAVSVYVVSNIEYAVVAEGNAAAETKGQVRCVRLSDGAVTTLVDDAEHVSVGVKAVKMSHTTYFRPRLYVLLTTGDVVVYYLKPEFEPTVARYSKTISNADLLAIAAAPWMGEHATVTALEVTDNGERAVIGYRRNAGDETEAAGPVTLAVLGHTAPSWTYYPANAAGNPAGDGSACITDGNWVLRCTPGTGKLNIGTAANNGTAYANGYRAEYLDLSVGRATEAGTSTSYTIQVGYNYALRPAEDADFKAPRVLLNSSTWNIGSLKFLLRDNESEDFEEVVLESDGSYNLGSWLCLYKNNRRVVMRQPGVGSLAANAFYNSNDATGAHYGRESNFAEDWDLSGLKTIKGAAWKSCYSHGRLDLPSIVTIEESGLASTANMTEIRLSEKKKTLATLGKSAVTGGKLKRVVLGCAEGCTFAATSCFSGQPLEEVIFTGAIPTFSSTAVHWPDTKEKQLVFAVPRGDAAWEALVAGNTKSVLADADRKAWRVAHPGTCIPFAVLAKEALQTKYDQYVAYNDTQGGYALKIERDEFFDDEVEVTSDWAPDADGKYMPGTVITLTAKPGTTGTFRKWYGDVAPADCRNASFSFAITNDVWLYCRFVHPWTLAADRKTASNGNFTINCSVDNESKRTLKAGANAKFGLWADDDVGQGVCDLGGDVTCAADGTAWTFVGIPATSGVILPRNKGRGDAQTFISPGTFASLPDCQFMHWNSHVDASSFNVLVFDEPTVKASWRGWSTCGNFNTQKVILQLPALKAFPDQACFWTIPLTETKFDWWDLSGLTEIHYQAFANLDWNKYVPCSGTATFPSLRGVNAGTTGSGGSPLHSMANVNGFVLGGRDRTMKVTNVCDYAFYNDVSLSRLCIYNDKDIVVGANLFSSGHTPSEIVLTGRAFTSETCFANLLAGVTAAETKPVKVYASANMGWINAAYLDAATDAEKAEAPGEVVLGVYRGGAAAPSGKALVIHRASPFDPKGLFFFVK